MIRAHSFDVFDTLLVRIWARPIDVLRAAADLAAHPEAPRRDELVSEVTRRRRAAEFQAIDRTGSEAVGLDAIYAELGDLEALGVDPGRLRTAELEVEGRDVRPVLPGRELVDAARRAGRRVIFVSDMYLPEEHIRAALARFGIRQGDEPLYVSGELGVSKRSGRLFDHVLADQALRPDELVHTGDDPVTDLASPARRGIAVEPFTGARLNRFEEEMLSRGGGRRPTVARLAGVGRASRVAQPALGSGDAAAAGADVAGPLFAGFVGWALDCARAQGIERLYFVSRDAQVLLRVAERLARPGDPELRYLYGSRQAWLLPGVDRVSLASLNWILEPEWALRTPRSLLAKLEVTVNEAQPALDRHGLEADERLADQAQLDSFWRMVVEDLPALVMKRAESARAIVSDYFEQEGLHDGAPWALVDLGWRLTAQRALRRILAHAGHEDAVRGFYFGISRRRTPLIQSGPFEAWVLEDEEPDARFLPEAWFWNNTIFVEHVFAMADHGSCRGYRREGERVTPVLREFCTNPRAAAFRDAVQGALLDFASELAQEGHLPLGDLRELGLLTGRLLIEQPRAEEAAALGWVPVVDDQNETRTKELAAPLSPSSVWLSVRDKLGLPVVRDFDTDNRWREGSLALTPPLTRGLFDTLRSGELMARAGRSSARRSAVYGRWRRLRAR